MEKDSNTTPNTGLPRHWVGMEELTEGYWTDAAVREKRGQEFFEKPIETIAKIDATDKAGVARREFLTIMGASMAMASFACARRPVHKIIPYVVKPEEITPGVATFYASSSPHTGYGILVKTREGRPIKLEGNPDHPVNRGALNARMQADILSLYDPDRLKNPVRRERGSSGAGQMVSWQDADSAIVAKLRSSRNVRILSAPVLGESSRKLIREFLSSASGGEHVEIEAINTNDLVQGQELCYGTAVVPHYNFDQADVVLSLGSDFLGNDPFSEEYAADWVKKRKVDGYKASGARMSKLYCFEAGFTITGGGADERFGVRAGDELKAALAVAYELIVNRKESRYAGDAAVQAALAGYKPEAVAQELGLAGGAEVFKRIAHDLWSARGKSIVIGGGVQAQTETGLALQVAINLLNSALENDGATIDGRGAVSQPRGNVPAFVKLVQDMAAGKVDALIIWGTNPAYFLPNSGFAAAAAKVPFIVAVSDREDETARLADFVLPDNHYLESWGDSTPRAGIYALQQPAISPIHDTRAFQDGLLAWSGKKGDFHEYLMSNWRETVFRQAGNGATFDQFWENSLRKGVVLAKVAGGGARSFNAAAIAKLPKYAATPADTVVLSLYANVAIYDGTQANNAWLQELPEPISSVTWDNYLAVGPALAEKLSLKNDDVVEVKSGDVSVELPVYVQPGLHPGSVSAAVGYGRRNAGKVGDGCGVDVYPFVKIDGGRAVFSGQKVELRKTGRFYKLASTQWHTVTEDRPIINDITLAEFKKNPATANHTDPHLRLETVPTLWPKHEYKGHRWGMAIDLNSCLGCGACMIACQAENNIPVVGRDQVRVSRQMHWIRIDRYYSGSAENPEVVFQPMLCQHCENASCETVCPVLATVHNDEGLNVQVYNRCVGTRYCQNNCPYKVRRFNFFDHWKAYDTTMNMAWNPDVTVRTRGIMEKCTFCVQRIREVKDLAKDKDEKVKDGSIVPACAQTCSTDAIVFGDMNDPESRVSKLRADPRAFRALEILNNVPSISYMTKVRNVERAGSHASGGEHHG